MKPLRIHFFTSFVYEQGTYFRFHNLARGLKALGQEVVIYGCDHDGHSKSRTEVRDGVEYQITPVSRMVRIFDANSDPGTAIKNAFQRRPPCDIAHLFQPFPTAAMAWKRSSARARFWDWDDLWTHEGKPRPLRPLRQHWPKAVTARMERHLPRQADHVTAIDAFLSDLARERQARKVTLLYNPSPALPLAGKLEGRMQFGLDPTAFYVGFMGFTIAEMSWCLKAVEQNLYRFPSLRFAICGPSRDVLGPLPAGLEQHVDALGRLSQAEARQFAASVDLALLPMEDNLFNRSRFPVKFSEYMLAGTPVLCSQVGECALLAPTMPWVLPAGTTETDWLAAFPQAVERTLAGQTPCVDQEMVRQLFSDETVCRNLLGVYRAELNG